MPVTKQLAVALFTVAGLTACGSAENTDESGSATSIKPHGPGGDATLTFTVPDKLGAEFLPSLGGKSTLDAMTFTYGRGADAVQLRPGVPTRVQVIGDGSPGSSTFFAEIGSGTNRTVAEEHFPFKSGDHLVLKLGAVHLHGSVERPTIALDPFSLFEVIDTAPNDGVARIAARGPGVVLEGAQVPLLPLVAGRYEYSYGDTNIASSRPFDVREGEVTDLDISASGDFAHLLLVREAASLPDQAGVTNQVTLHCRKSGAKAEQATAIARDDSDLRIFTLTKGECSYVVNGVKSAVVEFDPHGQASLRVARLDVADVELTDEAPGTFVRGTFVVSQGRTIVYTAPTNTGVDLAPGRYHLSTQYKSLLGAPRTLEQDFEL